MRGRTRVAGAAVALLASSVLAGAAGGHTYITTCFDESDDNLRFLVNAHGNEAGGWRRPFRSYFEVRLLSHESMEAAEPLSRFVVFHCPTGESVIISGLHLTTGTYEDEWWDLVNEAETESILRPLWNITGDAFENGDPMSMSELAKDFEYGGFRVTTGKVRAETCACELYSGTPIIE